MEKLSGNGLRKPSPG